MPNRAVQAFTLAAASAPLVMAFVVTAEPTPQLDREFTAKILPLLKKHCASCHGGKQPTAGLALDKAVTTKQIIEHRAQWQRLVFNVKSRSMPPAGGPTEAERTLIVDWFERALGSDCQLSDAGKVTLRRLNRRQYQNTVHDLLGVDVDLTKDFPSDDVGNGFDNIGDVLTVSPLLLEKYLGAAESATKAAIKVPSSYNLDIDPGSVSLTQGVNLSLDGELGFFAQGDATKSVRFDEPGDYTIKIRAWAQQAGPDVAKLRVTWDQKVLDTIPVKAQQGKLMDFALPVTAAAGQHVLKLTFANDYYDPQNKDPQQRDRNLYVSKIEISRPAVTPSLPNGPITSLPKSEADLETPRQLLEKFAGRAYRRPAQKQEVDRLLKLYQAMRKKGDTYEAAVQTCLQAVLTSPHFLFRVEAPPGTKGDRPLSDGEIATRLSYFLWGTMPDAELSKAVQDKKLRDPKSLAAQVERMLSDSKAKNLGDDFAVQWLQLRKIENSSPDPRLFPEFNDGLRADMLREVEALFMDAVTQNRSVLSLVQTDRVFVNGRLAKLYGIQGVTGDQIREVKATDSTRGGLFGTAAFLTVSSNPNRTSPVKRGKWILEQILGTPPPSPPPDVGILPQDQAIKPTLPMKERLAQHRRDPSCANCHRAMDAMGFSLEKYDAIGRIRSKDGDLDIDSKGELPDGTVVDGIKDLQKLVLSRKRDFVRCLAEKLLTYAVGRGMRPEDGCHLDKIVKTTEASGFKMHSLIVAVVQSDPFCKATVAAVVH